MIRPTMSHYASTVQASVLPQTSKNPRGLSVSYTTLTNTHMGSSLKQDPFRLPVKGCRTILGTSRRTLTERKLQVGSLGYIGLL